MIGLTPLATILYCHAQCSMLNIRTSIIIVKIINSIRQVIIMNATKNFRFKPPINTYVICVYSTL